VGRGRWANEDHTTPPSSRTAAGLLGRPQASVRPFRVWLIKPPRVPHFFVAGASDKQVQVQMPGRKRPHRSGAICRVRWSGAASGARPRHVRVRVVSRFSALQKRAKILKWRQMRAFSGSVSEWCGRAVPARFLPGSCPAPARLLPGSCPVPAQRPVPARFLPGSCPVPARFLPDGRAGIASVGRFLRRSRAATAAPLLGAAPPLCGRFLPVVVPVFLHRYDYCYPLRSTSPATY